MWSSPCCAFRDAPLHILVVTISYFSYYCLPGSLKQPAGHPPLTSVHSLTEAVILLSVPSLCTFTSTHFLCSCEGSATSAVIKQIIYEILLN